MSPAKKRTGLKSMPKQGRDPTGGLTASGREYFKEKEGANLRPGVRGPADTPKKMVRKGSFLRRHFANPPGPVVDEQGRPTRQALQAAAWGEPVPKTEADEKKLAAKGSQLLERYHAAEGDAKAPSTGGAKTKSEAAGTKTAIRKTAEKKSAGTAAKKAATKTATKGGARPKA